jgi:hypothetical protein
MYTAHTRFVMAARHMLSRRSLQAVFRREGAERMKQRGTVAGLTSASHFLAGRARLRITAADVRTATLKITACALYAVPLGHASMPPPAEHDLAGALAG